MARFAAFLRAVNVGGTGKLPKDDLVALCGAAGYQDARTYIASGNVAFSFDGSAHSAQTALEAELARYAGKKVRVFVRTAEEMQAIREGNPFPDKPGNRVIVLFLDDAPSALQTGNVKGQSEEEIREGERVLYVRFPNGQGQSKLVIPGTHTARNMNTVTRLAEMTAGTK